MWHRDLEDYVKIVGGFTIISYWFSGNIYQWKWPGVPLSEVEAALVMKDENRAELCRVDTLIKQLPITEAITHPSQYVRECRKWYITKG